MPPRDDRSKEGWKSLSVDDAAGTVTREPGLRLDAGGIGKGLAADLVAEYLSGFGPEAFTVNCLGDIRSGGISATMPRSMKPAWASRKTSAATSWKSGRQPLRSPLTLWRP